MIAAFLAAAPVPAHDWQFWVVTVCAILAGLYIVRSALPERLRPLKRRGKATSLTIGGKSPTRK
ncbi:MAG: hypothetical protein JSR77_17460 [Planctomycetes bacterium]|nr:hypothetical protein [Planctomycetota bacterium]